ncbi:MAG: phosphotransferase family protein, partial [Chloroflexi bacterium]|nr:phosphotransferase family protein [Chloroflexota bacterium]
WTADGKPQSRSFVARLKAVSGPQVFPEYDLAKQYRIVELLQNTDVPVPRLYGYEADESVIGVPFYIMGRVEGRLPLENPPYPAQGWLKECTTAERAEIWKSGIEAFARIHKLDWKKLGFGFLDRPERGAIPLDQELHYYREFYDWTRKGRRHPLCEETMAWLDANKPAREPVGLCWGDAKLGNMVFKGTHCEAVFDWELVHLGNPVDDVAWYLMLDACLSEGCGIPRLDGFLSREETVAHWERASGLKAQNFEYYEVFSAYRFSLIMYRIISMRKETGGWPADSDYDVNNLASFVLARHMASRR